MIELFVWLIQLPFVLLGAALSDVFSVVGVVFSLVGAILGAIAGFVWTVFCIGMVVLLVYGLIKLLDRKPVTA